MFSRTFAQRAWQAGRIPGMYLKRALTAATNLRPLELFLEVLILSRGLPPGCTQSTLVTWSHFRPSSGGGFVGEVTMRVAYRVVTRTRPGARGLFELIVEPTNFLPLCCHLFHYC